MWALPWMSAAQSPGIEIRGQDAVDVVTCGWRKSTEAPGGGSVVPGVRSGGVSKAWIMWLEGTPRNLQDPCGGRVEVWRKEVWDSGSQQNQKSGD